MKYNKPNNNIEKELHGNSYKEKYLLYKKKCLSYKKNSNNLQSGNLLILN